MTEDSTSNLESQSYGDKKDFIEPDTAILVGAGLWWLIKAMASSIAGWIGIQIFKRFYDRVRGWIWGKHEQGEGSSEKVSEEESAAASCRSLSGGCDGGRVFQSESESDQS